MLHTLHKWNREWTKLDYQIEDNLTNYWVNFAKTGDPNSKGLPEWKVYDSLSGNILLIGDKIESKPGLFKKELDFLEKFNPAVK